MPAAAAPAARGGTKRRKALAALAARATSGSAADANAVSEAAGTLAPGSGAPPRERAAAAAAVARFFCAKLLEGALGAKARKRGRRAAKEKAKEKKAKETEPEAVYREWLCATYARAVGNLLECVRAGGRAVAPAAVAALLELARCERLDDAFSLALFGELVDAALRSADGAALGALLDGYGGFGDVQHHACLAVRDACEAAQKGEDNGKEGAAFKSEAERERFLARAHALLTSLPPPPASTEEALEAPAWAAENEHEENDEAGEAIEGPPGKRARTKAPKWRSCKARRAAFGAAWLALLGCTPLPRAVYRATLAKLPTAVIPYLPSPHLLADFLGHAYEQGGLVAILALNSVFLLMTRHGLEYPRFYAQLYALLSPQALVARHRGQFLELLNMVLLSPLLPSYLAAAFAKRLARLALSAPPWGAATAVALAHNLVRRHAALAPLLHREGAARTTNSLLPDEGPMAEMLGAIGEDKAATEADESKQEGNTRRKRKHKVPRGEGDAAGVANTSGTDGAAGKDDGAVAAGFDPYDHSTTEPLTCHAAESSLWELASLKRHICPLVARAVSMLEADVTRRDRVTQDVPVADFARASYRSMLDEEAGRKLKSVPVAFYKARPTSVFALGLVAGGGLGVEGGEEKDAPAEVEVAEGQRADARDDAFEGWSFA